MSPEDTNELSKLFDVLYRIDQRLLCDENLQDKNQNEYGKRENKNTRRDSE